MNRLSSPIEAIKEHYKVVVIGSGYGGGISASRMARAGQTVCLLERGKEMQPGEYPETESEGLAEMQFHMPKGHLGSRTGLFDFHVHQGINVLVGCGLGGTSLINANVALRATPSVWQDTHWPKELRGHVDSLLEEGYKRAEAMLCPKPYPKTEPELAKLQALEASAKALNKEGAFYRPPINVTFEDGKNPAGIEQKACIHCGDCVSGCNHWAKNTTLMNYIPDAWNHGAEIFTETSVRYIEHKDGSWLVHFEPLQENRHVFKAPSLFVRADVVIVAAGTLGSTEILLRSKEKGLSLSDQVGNRLSGNGDVLAFSYDGDREVNGIGFARHLDGSIKPVGPCITGIIDLRSTEDWREGFVIEEGSMPGLLASSLPFNLASISQLVGKEEKKGLLALLKERGSAALSLVQGAYRGAVNHTQTYLVMAHDGSKGVLSLKEDRLIADWPNYGKEPIFQTINDTLFEASKALGGNYIKDPIWTKALGESLISVHPLGGCIMADDSDAGVVNHKGQVFNGSGQEVHEGLYVSDGSIIPVSLGVNPLLSISAIAERNAYLLAEDKGWQIDYSMPSVPRDQPVKAKTPGIQFTETMKGYVSKGENKYLEAERQGKAANTAMEFTLTINASDVEAMLKNKDHKAQIVGTVSASLLSEKPLLVKEGSFDLFIDNPDEVATRNMTYSMHLVSEEGESFYFHGFKTVNEGSIAKLWPQTTTLYVTVYKGEDEQGEVLCVGILHIKPADFLKQMTTMKVTNASGEKERLHYLGEFGHFFAGVLFHAYGGVFVKQSYFNPEAPARKKRALRVSAPSCHPFTTCDGVELLLSRYQGGEKGPVVLIHGAGVSSGIFSTDLIGTNLLEYLYIHGYDVWLFDFRVSIALSASETQSNGDQIAHIDHPEAIAKIKELTGAKSVQAVVHCYGSNTFFMAMLAGLEGVRSIVCSQVATNLISPVATRIKTGLHFPNLLEAVGFTSLTAYVDSNANWKNKLFDELLNLTSDKAEVGNNPVSERIAFMYGQLYELAQLNERTYKNLHELFGVANMKTFEHLALMVRHKQVMSHEGQDNYMPHLARLALPIRFIHGADNKCYLPESTKKTLELLSAENGPEFYSRHVIAGYGHIDCIFGKNAVNDVFPLVLEHLEKDAFVS